MPVVLYIIKAQYWLLNVCLKGVRSILYKRGFPRQARKVLVVRKGNLGDWICSIDAVLAIKQYFKSAQLDVLTTTGHLSTIGATDVFPSGTFNQVFDANAYSLSQLYKLIKNESYDAVIELPPDVDTFFNQWRNLFFFRFCGITHGGGWTVSRTTFMQKLQSRYLYFENEQARLEKIVLKLPIPVRKISFDLFSDSDKTFVDTLVLTEKPIVVLAPGAKLFKKRWPIHRFAQVADYYTNQGKQVVVIGDDQDRTEVEQNGFEGCLNFCGALTVQQSAALLHRSALCISNDSGPMHLSYTVGTPLVALFSARNYRGKWFPPLATAHVLLSHFEVPCSGCMNKPCDDNICMKLISVEEVIQSANRLLEVSQGKNTVF